MLHLVWHLDNLIESDVSTVLNVFLLLSVSWWLPEGFHNQAEGSPSSGPVYSGGSVLLSSSDIPDHWSPWQCHHQHDIRLNLGGIMEVAGV